MLLEIRDLLPGQRHGGLLFLLQGLTFAHQTVVLGPGFFIADEGVDALADRLHVGLLQNDLAKFLGFAEDWSFFNHCFHKFILVPDPGIVAVCVSVLQYSIARPQMQTNV